MNIPDAAVEAAVTKMYGCGIIRFPDTTIPFRRERALGILAAAAPYIAAQVGEQIAKGIEDEWDADVVLHEIHENSREEVWDRCQSIARQFEIEEDHG